jgi:hypothetical protein
VVMAAAPQMHSILPPNFPAGSIKTGKRLRSEALHCNTSYLTAVANDYSYDVIYARLVDGICEEGDVLVGLSTSGNSKNILKHLSLQRTKVITVGFTGADGGKMKDASDFLFNVPSNDTEDTGKPYPGGPYYLRTGRRKTIRLMQAIILAGGLGTRLREAVPDLPKCMAPVNNRPFIALCYGSPAATGC